MIKLHIFYRNNLDDDTIRLYWRNVCYYSEYELSWGTYHLYTEVDHLFTWLGGLSSLWSVLAGAHLRSIRLLSVIRSMYILSSMSHFAARYIGTILREHWTLWNQMRYSSQLIEQYGISIRISRSVLRRNFLWWCWAECDNCMSSDVTPRSFHSSARSPSFPTWSFFVGKALLLPLQYNRVSIRRS